MSETTTQTIPATQLSYGAGQATTPAFLFDGDAGSYLGTNILAALLTVATLGIAAPWAMCMREHWKAQHTFIEGRRYKFVGRAVTSLASGFFGVSLLWSLSESTAFG